MLQNTEGEIKNVQSRETGKIGYTRRKTKQNKSTTQYVLEPLYTYQPQIT